VKLTKDIISFLKEHITSNGEYQEAAVDAISHLNKSFEGCKIVIQNS
jgi:thiamine phosphate synthase YjbQ (UPF0047 family)